MSPYRPPDARWDDDNGDTRGFNGFPSGGPVVPYGVPMCFECLEWPAMLDDSRCPVCSFAHARRVKKVNR